jgi:signal transduction histidine kinase
MVAPLRILLVDDDDVDRRAVKRMLRQAGFDVEIDEQIDRAGALAATERQRFDCVLLDYRLPGTDGVSLLRDLRDHNVGVPVVALTGHGDEEVAVELMKAGASDYLNKNTLTSERLRQSLRYALAIAKAEDERNRLLEREHHARLEAQAANRAKDEFLATLSHELRTPLNAILGWSQLLAGGQLQEATRRRAIEIIERNTRLQVQLIDDLLDVSRIVTGKVRLDLKPMLVRTIIDAAVEAALPTATAQSVEIHREVPDEAIAVLCDGSRMQQVLSNLLSNAIKFTPAGGLVTVSERRDGSGVVLTVSDTGEGIEPRFLPHVFDRFRQQDPASTREHGGLGLGLSIVRHLVELHGGAIEAHSEGLGRGAAFVVRLPVSPVAPDAEGTPNAREPRSPSAFPEALTLEGIRVLVVDNDADARGLVSAILESRGAEVESVGSTAEAISSIRKRRPDVLLSDIAMPGEDGYSLIRKVRLLDGPDEPLPAAALTAYATPGDRAEAILAGYHAHLPKPIEPTELAAAVAALAGRSAYQRDR